MAKQIQLTMESPLTQRFGAYLHERFPLLNHGLLIVSYYSSNQFLAQVLDSKGAPVHYSGYTAMGALTIFCMFFHLRVFDEHKDFQDDIKFYPERILSQGLITLDQLKILGFIVIAVELLMGVVRGLPALLAVLLAIGFSLLMFKEFFISEWLRQHFLFYAISHMFIMPIFALVIYSFTTGNYFWQAPNWFILYAFVGFFVSFNWEISRKIRAPEDEIKGVGSYSKIFGTYGAAYLVIVIRVIDTALVSLVGWHLQLSAWFYAVLILLFFVCLISLVDFRLNTNAKTAKRMENVAGLYIIVFDLTLVVEIIRKFTIAY
jgi:4-hydroxybenzoate polyprenyltransferase